MSYLFRNMRRNPTKEIVEEESLDREIEKLINICELCEEVKCVLLSMEPEEQERVGKYIYSRFNISF